MLTFSPAMKSLLATKTHRFAKLWEIRRTDGTILRFTDHSRTIFYEGFDYVPTGGGSSSAKQRLAGLETSNTDFMGVITSAAITFDDLWAGRYREAEVLETRVDWKYPWVGRWDLTRYWIEDTEFDGETWTAKLTEFPTWLGVSNGDVYGRTCRWSVYQQGCGVSPGMYQVAIGSCAVSVVNTPYLKFEIIGVDNAQSNNYYNGGDLLWIYGRNAGIRQQVKVYTNTAPRNVELQLKTPLPIQVGDLLNFWRGCNKLRTGDCTTIFNNQVNFGGFDTMPGTDEMVQVKR